MADLKLRYNETRADKAVRFFSNQLTHTKGRWSGSPFILEDWQEHEIIRPLFGMEYYDEEQSRWLRLYRKAYIELPKKNGKSALGSGISLQGLHADKEPGPEVYSVASTKKQAGIVFGVAADMTVLNPALDKRSTVNRSRVSHHGVIYVPKTRGVYQVIPGDAEADDGINPSRVVLDELHRLPNREIYDLLDNSFSARLEPLYVIITTAGIESDTSVSWELHEHARKASEGTLNDPHLFVYMKWATQEETEGDGWLDEDLWRRTNPAMSFNPGLLTDMRQKAAEAQESPAKILSFKRLRLNVWFPESALAANRLFDIASWDRSAGMAISIDGRDVGLGIDMAATTDMTSLLASAWNEPGECANCRQTEKSCLDVEAHFWIPAETLAGSKAWSKAMKAQLRSWVDDGWIKVVDGAVIDDPSVKAAVYDVAERCDITSIALDPWQSRQLRIDLEDEGFTVFEHRQTMQYMSPATKQLIELVVDGRFHHGGNPVLRWMADSVVAKVDSDDNIKPDRKKSRGKIDGIVAGVMSITASQVEDEGEDVFAFSVGGSAS